MKKIISVVGARPNFMKIAPLHRAFNKYKEKINHLICHTGQHYDEKMSKVFFEDLGLPRPEYYLGVGSGTHAKQTAAIMVEFEKILLIEKPDMVLVVGDVNSTIACSLTAVKMGIKIIHVEAGLRSFDRDMPEEINRILTDTISDYLFVTEESGLRNLKNEGISPNKIFFTGNVMIDSLAYYLKKTSESDILKKFALRKGEYAVTTLHRPSNVDNMEQLLKLVTLLNNVAEEIPVLFPVHPRTRNSLEKFDLLEKVSANVLLTDPVGYIEFITLVKDSLLVITDSGGIQEETTWLGVQCITLRNSTERPVTVESGTNQLLGNDLEAAEKAALDITRGKIMKGSVPPLWDGNAAERIAEIILNKER